MILLFNLVSKKDKLGIFIFLLSCNYIYYFSLILGENKLNLLFYNLCGSIVNSLSNSLFSSLHNNLIFLLMSYKLQQLI